MKEKIVNSLMIKIRAGNNYDDVKLEEIRYGLLGMYSLITKTSTIILLSFILGFIKEFMIFLIFYSILRSVSFGCHAKSNVQCWIFSTILLLGIPYLFSILSFTNLVKNIIWLVCFINFLIFSPADTDKRPMINKMRKLKFKFITLLICCVYILLINKFSCISNLILAAMILESLLVNPLGYILMGQKVRFKLNDIYLVKQKREGGI